ncbi:hypothetical protein SASPL_119805 [Salvia splendens]|uniref:Uncharacterized protein n=1 Tax=Salvia splendens TaxID=180675 RepID=A0A8X8XP02_SALSN|nr:hypothetical protein SASPL_119805 [Salvia splendens]
MKNPVEKSSDQGSGSIGNAQAMNTTCSSNEALRILEMQERKEKEAVETAGTEVRNPTKKLQPRRSLRISEMQEEKEAVETAGMEVRNPTNKLQPRRSLRMSEMQERNEGKGKKEAVETAGVEVRNPTKKLQPRRSLRISEMQERNEGKGKEEAMETAGVEVRNPTKKLQPRSNASLRIGNAEVSEMQERNKGKGKEKGAVETAAMMVRKPTKKEVEDDARRVTEIIKKWTALRWEPAYSSKSPPISKKFYRLESKCDDDLRKLLLPGDQAAVVKDGLSVPTVDDKGRRFSVVLKQSSGYLFLTGEGWSELVQLNMVEMRSVFQIYSYRDGRLKFGGYVVVPEKLPNYVVPDLMGFKVNKSI